MFLGGEGGALIADSEFTCDEEGGVPKLCRGVQIFPNKVDNKWVHNRLVSALQLLAKRVLTFFVRHRQFFFKMSCRTFDDVQSHNVIGEITGSEFPNEIIVVGGHLDSWDLGDGSHDDGAGVVQSMEVLRLLKESNITPKRTIRVVLFMNEENGLRGGNKYADVAKQKNENHIFALESDAGGFTPRGFSFDCTDAQFKQVEVWKPLFKPYLIHFFEQGGSGADIGPLKNGNSVLAGLRPDSQRYFDYHHAANDTFEAVNKRELELGAATMTSLVYLYDTYGVEGFPTKMPFKN